MSNLATVKLSCLMSLERNAKSHIVFYVFICICQYLYLYILFSLTSNDVLIKGINRNETENNIF